MERLTATTLLVCFAWCALPCRANAQAPGAPADLRALVRQVCGFQIDILQRHDTRLRYRVKRIDRKGETLRDNIESHDGGVARLLQRNGKPLTSEQEEGERKRLQDLLGTRRVQQREHDESRARSFGVELLRAMPEAMQYSLAQQQTPLADVSDPQVVIDFAPSPTFHPSSMTQQILTQLSGRLWINLVDHQLLRIEARNTGEVTLAWGLLAKVYTGGTILYDQRKFQDLYTFTHITLHLRIRELMLKVNELNTDTMVTEIQRMPESPNVDTAIRMLLGAN